MEDVEQKEVKISKPVKKRGITRENALSMVAHRRKLGLMGGRPKGVLGAKAIAKIKTVEAMVAANMAHLGEVTDDLLINSRLGDTRASVEILDRTIGPVRKDVHLTGDFSIKALHIVAIETVAPTTTAPDDTHPAALPPLSE